MSQEGSGARLGEVDSLVFASRALLAIIARTIAPALEQVSLQQFRVLVVLVGAGPHRLGALAERLDVVPSTFSRTVDRMEANGWVTRRTSEGKRRETIVEVTDRGRDLVDGVTVARRNELSAVLNKIPAHRRQALVAAFMDFADSVGEPAWEDLLPIGL
ncbi:MarR family winged helix-turn-helix transcriptional regulator [Amnibacterium sp.]|uniref:MarR family winged helix-turn-helix transcriptional regulator n=1 Tax=Amnibacterium sp. TaxID=1872496 RepID=UPI003F7C5337